MNSSHNNVYFNNRGRTETYVNRTCVFQQNLNSIDNANIYEYVAPNNSENDLIENTSSMGKNELTCFNNHTYLHKNNP